jgi:toxin YoeB
MRKTWHDPAWGDYLYWQTQDKKTLKKINRLIQDIERNGYVGMGKPEPLKENLAGWWSVKIDGKNRIVFKIAGEIGNQTLEIAQCGSHYRDK